MRLWWHTFSFSTQETQGQTAWPNCDSVTQVWLSKSCIQLFSRPDPQKLVCKWELKNFWKYLSLEIKWHLGPLLEVVACKASFEGFVGGSSSLYIAGSYCWAGESLQVCVWRKDWIERGTVQSPFFHISFVWYDTSGCAAVHVTLGFLLDLVMQI